MALTDDQLKKLVSNRRSKLPSYYDSVTGVSSQIPASTQDALILMSSTTKKKAVDYLKQLSGGDPSQRTADYNELLEEVTATQALYSEAISQELETVTGKFNDFLDSLSGNLDSAGSSIQAGMQPVMRAMTRSLGRLVAIDKNEYFHRMFDDAMYSQYRKDEANDIKKELRSWIRAFVSYP